MSIHVIPGTAREAGWNPGPLMASAIRVELQTGRLRIAERVFHLCFALLRPPASLTDNGTSMVLTFTPDLTAPEQATLDRIARVASALVEITPAEWATIEGDIQNGRDYLQAASPNAAQTVTALKSAFRILRALIRD